MYYYRITCLPNGEKQMALSATDDDPGKLVIAQPNANEDRQVWQLMGFAAVDDNKGTWGYYLINKHNGRVAEAPHDDNGDLQGNTQGVSLVDVASSWSDVSPIRIWTVDFYGGAFAIRPWGDVHQNLNAWNGSTEPGTEVGIYSWGNGKPSEIWTLTAVQS